MVSKEPYRFFFPLGALAGIVGVGHWLLFGIGILPQYSAFFHSSFQVELYMGCFVFGFLLTALPRFLGASTLSSEEFLAFVFFAALITFFHLWNYPVLAEFSFAGWVLLFARFARSRFRKEKISCVPVGFFWIPFALLNAFIGSVLLAAVQMRWAGAGLMAVAKPMLEQGFVLSVVLGIGGFLGPRLMGINASLMSGAPVCFGETEEERKRKIQIHAFSALMLFLSFWLPLLGHKNLGYWIRAGVVTFQLIFSGAIPCLPKAPGIYPKLLAVSFWMVFVGSWAAVLWPALRTAMIHLLFLGGFSWMTFFVATMVVLNHAGRPQELSKPLWIFWVMAGGFSLAVILRVAAVFIPENYFHWLAAASLCWIAAVIGWLVFSLPYLARVPREANA